MENHAAGVSMIAFIVAVAVSMGYYQFVYLPEANAKPILPDEVIEPAETLKINIAEGSSTESNPRFFEPREARATIGISNLVVWHNSDTVPHTVTTDDDYRDAYSGTFDSRERPEEEGGPFVMPGEDYEFLFTKVGTYAYHCEPHPWMQGEVEVIENFA
jgi:plastocyanin